MKLSKGRKITAWVTLSIMLVAIVAVTAGVLTNIGPKTYQGEDVAPETAALNYKIDQAVYTLSNASLTYMTFHSGSDSADLRILFPNTIYIDNSENLENTGYYFAYDVWVESNNNYANRTLLFDNMFGYFKTSDSDVTKPSGNAATMHNVFKDYGAQGKYLNGSTTAGAGLEDSIATIDDNKVKSRNSLTIVGSRENSARSINNTVKIKLTGTVNNDYQSNGTTAKTATFEHGCGQYQMAFAQWFDSRSVIGSNTWKDLGKQAHFGNWSNSGAAGTGIFHGISPFDNESNLTEINKLYYNLGSTCNSKAMAPNDIKVNIYVYDKSKLDAAVKRFEDNMNLLKTLNGNDTLATAANNYLTSRKKVLTDREVTQDQINTATNELNNYYFDLAVPTSAEESASRGNVSYNGSSRTPDSSVLGRFGTSSNKYFNFEYRLNGTASELKNVGTYDVYAQPKSSVDDMKFRWSGGTTDYKKIGTYTITPAQMAFKNGRLKNSVSYDYKNQDYSVTVASALESGYGTSLADSQFDNYYNSTDNPRQVYTSLSNDWTGVQKDTPVTLKNAGTYTVYYKITATNHSDITGNFSVTIAKANMSIANNTIENKSFEFKNSAYALTLESALVEGKSAVEFTGYYGDAMTIVYVLGSENDEIADVDWSSATSSVSVTNVGKYVVFFKATANNHNDYASSFEVEIEKANIQLTVDTYSQYYGDTLLDSDGIIDNMLTNTAKVLDATSWADIKAYIKDICTFGVSGTTLAEGHVKVGEYAIAYTRNTDWNDRIATISFTNDASKAYVVDPKEVSVTWTQQANMYYNGEGSKRPSAAITGNDLVPGTTTSLSAVRITGAGVDFEGNSVALKDGEAIFAGTYEAYVTCSNENYAVAEASKKCNFEILRRPITVELQDRDRVYASKGTAGTVWHKYTTTDLANNMGNEVYVATIDTTVVEDGSGVLVDTATKVFEINHNATEDDFTSTTESERYFKVNTYELTLTLLDKNYVLTGASKTTADFVIEPAEIDCDLQSITAKVYNGQEQSLALPNNNTDVTMQGYEAAHRDSIKIQYKAAANGSYADTLLTRKDVGTTTVYYKITADNHSALEGSFTAAVSAVNVRVSLTTSNVKATYGDAVPTSAQLVEKLGIKLNWTSEATKIADVYDRIAFAVSGMTDRRANAGDYSLTHKYIGEEVGKNNFNITYIDDCGIDAYTIEPKSLYIEWKQEGPNWAENGMEYFYDGTAPVFTPVAPDTLEDGTENVVVIDSTNRDTVQLAEIQLTGRVVNSYSVSTSLSNPDNINNYTIQNPTATFKIIPRVVKIYAKNQSAVYGRAKTIALGELELPDTKWAYPSDAAASAKFLSDDYSAFALTSIAQTPLEGQSYRDAGNYDIQLEIIDENVAANYDVTIVTDGAPDDMKATFTITPAAIHFGAKRFNIDYDNEYENNYVTIKQMKDTVDTTLGTDPDEFTVKMSDLFKEDDAKFSSIANVTDADWVTSKTRTISDIDDIGVYYVWVRVEHHCAMHNHSNYEPFETKVQVNILSGWASIKIKKGGSSNAQYGDPVHTSVKIFSDLKENLEVYGGIKIKVDDENETYKQFTLDILEEYVTNGTVRFYVLNSDATEMEQNAAFGEYTIEIEVVDTSKEFKNFRFLDEDAKANTDKSTTNVDAYKVGKREIGVSWGQMNEVYGEHSESSPSHTYTITNVMTRNGVKDDVRITVEYSKKINGVWTVVKHADTLSVGEYKATVKTVSHPDYTLPEAGIEEFFSITKRTVIITLNDRSLTYGNANAKRDTIETYLNTRIQGFDRYTVVGKNSDGTMQAGKYDFLAGDTVADIFTFKIGDYTLDSKYSYLFADDYSILIEKNDNGVGANYDVQVQGAETAKLTINKSSAMTYAREFITSKVYQGKEINVVDPLGKVFDYINLVGDKDKLLEGKDPKTIVEYKLKIDGVAEDDSKYDAEYKVKDAGNYTVIIKVNEPNHTVKEFEATLTVAKAYVVINITGVAEKEYGDTEAQVLAKEEDASIDTFSKWLIKHCNITLTAYTENGGDEITVDNIYSDFEFKVVAKGNGNSDALEIGAYKVGTYRVHHRTNVEKDGKNVMDNYEVDYVEVAGSQNGYCNAEVYKINPKKVTAVDWATTGHIAEVENKFEFSNSRPSVTATYTLIGENTSTTIPLKYTLVQGESSKEEVINYGVGKYIAEIEIDTDDVRYAKFANYDFDGVDAYEFEIIAKNVTVIIKNQSFTYGTDNTKVGEWDWSDQFTRVEAGTFAGSPVVLSIEEKTDKQYYGVGTYHIVGKCASHNYKLTFKGEDENGQAGANDYAIFEVTPTTMSVSYPRHSVSYSGKAFSVDVKSILAANKQYTIKGDVLWSDATVTYKQEDGSYTSDIAVVEGLTSGNGLEVDYRVELANHVTYDGVMTIEIIPAKLVVNIAKGATSVYGDSLLTSDELFKYATLDVDKSSMTVDNLKELFDLRVSGTTTSVAGKVNKGTYNISYRMKAEYDTLYDVELVGEEGAYEVTAKTLTVQWNYTAAFEYDGLEKEVGYTLDGILGEEVVEISDLTDYAFTDAGNYVAKASRLSNANYKLAEETTLNWTIAPKAIKVDWIAGDFTYNKEEHQLDTPTIKENQLVGSDTCEITVEVDENVNAGTHTATAKTTNGNYVVDNNTFEFVIKPAPVSINWKETILTYNGSEQAPKAEVAAGLIEDDKCGIVVSGAQKNAGENYIATATLDNPNYTIDGDATETFKITAKAITFTWENTDTLKYTGEAQAPNAVANGVEGDDEVEFVIEGAQVNAGTGYTATVTGVNNSNYTIDETKQSSMTTNYSIGKGTNQFVEFVAPDKNSGKLPWTGDDKPDAKWGEVIVKYYSDADCTQEVTDIDSASEGTYWVKLTVAGTDNYDEISQIFEVVLEGGFNIVIVIIGVIASLALLVGAIMIVNSTNKKKQQGDAV